MDLPTTGKRYAVVGANITFVELSKLVMEFTGKKVRHFGASPAIAQVVGTLMELGARITGKELTGKELTGKELTGKELTGKEPAITCALVEENARRYQFIDASATRADFG